MTVENTTAPAVETTDAPNDPVADPETPEAEGPDVEAPGEIEIDVTEELSDDQIRDLFVAFNDEDWSEVDRLITEFEATGVWGGTETEGKAGGADRNRGSAEKLRRYWTVGVGGQKIRWGTSGDFRRCVTLLSKHLGVRAKGYCFTGDTEFLTRDGVMTFEDAVGTTQLVLTYDDPTRVSGAKRGKPVNKNKPVNYAGRWVEAPIQYYGEQPVLEVVLSRNGVLKTIKATPEHLWFASTDGRTSRRGTADAVRTDALSEGMALAAVFPKAATTRSTVSRVGVMAGFVYGDGHTQRRRGAFADLWGDKDAALLPYFDGCPSYPVKHDGLLGTRVYGMPAAFKDAPTLEEGVPYLMGWLAGYIAADGSVSTNGSTVTISSASRESLDLVRDVATLLGIGTYGVTEASRIGTGRVETPLYKVSFVADTMVADLLLIPEHRRRFAEYEARRGQGGTAGSPVRWTVVSVEDKGEVAPVYCAEVSGTENFALADNVWVHNCSLRHKEMNGFYPGSRLNKGDDGDMQTKDTGEQTPAMMEFKTFDLKGLDVVDAEQGIVEAIVSVTGVVDNVNDLILPGAYAKTLAARTPKGVYSHSWETPVSRTLAVKELMPGDPELPKTMPNGDPWPAEAGALKVKTQFNLSTQRGREAYSDVVFFGDDSAWSIGYQVPVGGAKIDQKSGVRRIADIDLYEYSPVLFGAMPLAHTTSVKKAQLAMKALQAADSTPWHHTEPQTEPPTARVVDQPRLPQIKDMVMETPEDQMVLVKQAIDVLTDLLAVVNADIDTKADMPEQEAPEAEEAVDYDTLTKALEAMVDDDGLRQTLTKVAEPVDAAIAADDADALDTSIGTFLDEVEAAMGDEENADLLKTIAAMVADLIEYLAGDDDDEAPESAEEPPTEDTVDIKRDYGPEAREKMAEDDEALDDGSFPIKNRTDLGNAIKAVGRAKDPDKARAHIKKRAKELDAEDMLPDSWNEEKVVLSADEIKAFVQQFNEK